MGDTSVDFFLETLKQLITSSKLDSIIEKKHQLQSLEEEIKYLRGFLNVTEKKRNEYSEVMKLVMEIRDVVSKAENMVERFVIDAFKANDLFEAEARWEWRTQGDTGWACSCNSPKSLPIWSTLSNCFVKLGEIGSRKLGQIGNLGYAKVDDLSEDLSDADDLSEDLSDAEDLSLDLESVKMEIKTLTAEVKQIYDENIYDINGAAVKKHKHSSTRSGGGSSSAGGSKASEVVKEKLVVGFDKEVEKLLEMLDDRGEGRPLEIITIIGAGGGGKTTLAKEVYHHPFMSHAFEIRAWVVVSQDYNKTTMKRDLLISVLKSAFPENQEDYEKSSEDMLGEKVLRSLKGRTYLIVMDDMWGIEVWNDIQRSYPNERKGSKVLFTSRQLVQLDCVPYYLNPLPKHQSWELLQKKVFGMNCCPPKLVDIGVKIAEKCKGLPLAIVTIAGILAKEDKTLDMWEEVAKHLSSTIAKNKEAGCMEILELSYNHLPLHLKACLLYIGAFNEDSEIYAQELSCLWIAEGFIQQSVEGKSLEDVARDHLIDLIDRSLVIVAKESSFGGVKSCYIHDLMRVFCLKKAEEENFLVQCYGDDSFSPPTNKHRRLVTGPDQFFREFSKGARARNLHSILCFPPANYRHKTKVDLSFLAGNFERLKVLSYITADSTGEIVGLLVHLRYLAITASCAFCAKSIFEWITNLVDLETLVLNSKGQGGYVDLPCYLFKMVKLRHLYSHRLTFRYHFSFEEAARISFDHSSKLHNLQTLHTMCACNVCLGFLVRTPNLRKLALEAYSYGDPLILPDLEFLKCLEKLSLSSFILKAGTKIPSTIKQLTLFSTRFKWEELSILHDLPSLEVLKFKSINGEGPVWNTSEEGFPKLKYLSLCSLTIIKEWNASEDQFPRLEVLVLQKCTRLERILIDFANLDELLKIKLVQCTGSVQKSAREIQKEQRNRKGDDNCTKLIVKNSIWD